MSAGINAVYFSHEITDEMIEEWTAEVEEYIEDRYLQLEEINHEIRDTSGERVLYRSVAFGTIARQIMAEAHRLHKIEYKEPDIDYFKNIIDKEEYLSITQIMLVQDWENRDPDDMNLILKIITPESEEKIIQPHSVVGEETERAIGNHLSVKSYKFDYNDFPSHQEYIDNDYEITGIHISKVGEIEIDIPWDEIR